MRCNSTLRRRSVDLAVTPLEGRQLLSEGFTAPTAHTPADVGQSDHNLARASGARHWAWLANTYWYVPSTNLLATLYQPSSGAIISVKDQTVYHISGYYQGYFWGETVSQFDSLSPSSSALVGTVTPQGHVLLNFSGSSNVTQGIGTMVRKGRQWTMENQMFSGSSSSIQIGHWAYMVQTRPGTKSWNSLPSAGVSVPQFLSNYSQPVPTPVF